MCRHISRATVITVPSPHRHAHPHSSDGGAVIMLRYPVYPHGANALNRYLVKRIDFPMYCTAPKQNRANDIHLRGIHFISESRHVIH